MSIVTSSGILRCHVADMLIIEWEVCRYDDEAAKLLGYEDWDDWSERFDSRLCDQLLGPHGWAIYKALRAKLEENKQ